MPAKAASMSANLRLDNVSPAFSRFPCEAIGDGTVITSINSGW